MAKSNVAAYRAMNAATQFLQQMVAEMGQCNGGEVAGQRVVLVDPKRFAAWQETARQHADALGKHSREALGDVSDNGRAGQGDEVAVS